MKAEFLRSFGVSLGCKVNSPPPFGGAKGIGGAPPNRQGVVSIILDFGVITFTVTFLVFDLLLGCTLMMNHSLENKPRKWCDVVDNNVILPLCKIVQGSKSYNSVSDCIEAMTRERRALLMEISGRNERRTCAFSLY